MRESVRTRGMSRSCRHSSRIMYLLECMFILEHCIFYRYRERASRRHVIEAVSEESRIVALAF